MKTCSCRDVRIKYHILKAAELIQLFEQYNAGEQLATIKAGVQYTKKNTTQLFKEDMAFKCCFPDSYVEETVWKEGRGRNLSKLFETMPFHVREMPYLKKDGTKKEHFNSSFEKGRALDPHDLLVARRYYKKKILTTYKYS